MADYRIIYVSQEIAPYLSVTSNGKLGKALPQDMQERKYEVRTFMPDFGDVNERRNQLHEVIRLSGINIPIGDNDHPLVVKVASMQPSRIQVYFIDNDDYFQKEDSDSDAFGSNRTDNDERMIFYAHGTMETARKLRWEPDVMSVSGWMSALVPLYLKSLYSDGPSFHRTKVVYTLLPEDDIAPLSPQFFDKLKDEGIKKTDLKPFAELPMDKNMVHKMGMAFSDGVVFQGVEPTPDQLAYCEELGKPVLIVDGEGTHADELDAFYKQLMPQKK